MTAIRSPSEVDSNRQEFFVRRGKALLRIEFDVSSLLTRNPASQRIDDEQLGKLVAAEIERLGRAASVEEAWPAIRPNAVIDEWRSEYPDLAVVPLSPDAGIVFTYSGGLLQNNDLEGAKIGNVLTDAAERLHGKIAARDAKHGELPLERRDAHVQSIGFLIREFVFPQTTPGSLVLSNAFWQDVRSVYPSGAYVAFPGGLRSGEFSDAAYLVDKRKPDAKRLLQMAMNRWAEHRRQIAENDPLCAFLKSALPALRKGNPHIDINRHYSTEIGRCEQIARLKRLGRWVPPPDMPTSRYIYEWADGKLVVAE